jgi:hypothetical protein
VEWRARPCGRASCEVGRTWLPCFLHKGDVVLPVLRVGTPGAESSPQGRSSRRRQSETDQRCQEKGQEDAARLPLGDSQLQDKDEPALTTKAKGGIEGAETRIRCWDLEYKSSSADG